MSRTHVTKGTCTVKEIRTNDGLRKDVYTRHTGSCKCKCK
ncbi:hypothetical protein HaLaN_27495, partial [Haematococcus lacustris]